jgi:hypothetical protein
MERYRAFWDSRFDALEKFLAREAAPQKEKSHAASRRRPRRR